MSEPEHSIRILPSFPLSSSPPLAAASLQYSPSAATTGESTRKASRGNRGKVRMLRSGEGSGRSPMQQ
eukprot:458576-Pelagomonas_calceolata.AAC.2